MCDEQAMTAEEWLYELQRPGAKLTPLKVMMLDALLRMRRKTVKQWGASIGVRPLPDGSPGDSEPLTQDEAVLCAVLTNHDRALAIENATAHLEGMVGTLDDFLAGTNPLYQAVAAKRSRPAPAIPESTNGVPHAV
jgi:hypothetical protein